MVVPKPHQSFVISYPSPPPASLSYRLNISILPQAPVAYTKKQHLRVSLESNALHRLAIRPRITPPTHSLWGNREYTLLLFPLHLSQTLSSASFTHTTATGTGQHQSWLANILAALRRSHIHLHNQKDTRNHDGTQNPAASPLPRTSRLAFTLQRLQLPPQPAYQVCAISRRSYPHTRRARL